MADAKAPAPEAPKRWVWRSSLESRERGQISVLACVETVLAVVLYWWIAIRFQTHFNLLLSAIFAPLLLLRSPQSMDAGVRWFMELGVEFQGFAHWPKAKRLLWIAGLMVFCFSSIFFLWSVIRYWMPNTAWETLISLLILALLSLPFTVCMGFALAGVFAREGAVSLSGTSLVSRMLARFMYGKMLGKLGFAAVLLPSVMLFGVQIGPAGRAQVYRFAATFRYCFRGIHLIPQNWRDLIFLTDSHVPPELLPGIRKFCPSHSLDGFLRLNKFQKAKSWKLVQLVAVCPTLIVLPFLYRLSIKATAWFWWPLAYLLKPLPAADKRTQQQQALCWPWTDPFQRFWIWGSLLLAGISLSVLTFKLAAYEALRPYAAPELAKIWLALDWSEVRPWHWIQWGGAALSLGMLAIAGKAEGHRRTGDWPSLRVGLWLPLMTLAEPPAPGGHGAEVRPVPGHTWPVSAAGCQGAGSACSAGGVRSGATP